MYETLEMMKSILNGKECKVEEKELIKEYQNKLSPNILAYFYVNNFGLILQIREKYPLLLDEDIASFCLQKLDKCLQTYDYKNKLSTYFYKVFNNKLSEENKKLTRNKRKININIRNIEDYKEKLFYNDINFFDINSYNLTDEEKNQIDYLTKGFTKKDIIKKCNYSISKFYSINKNIKEKLLNFV